MYSAYQNLNNKDGQLAYEFDCRTNWQNSSVSGNWLQNNMQQTIISMFIINEMKVV